MALNFNAFESEYWRLVGISYNIGHNIFIKLGNLPTYVYI